MRRSLAASSLSCLVVLVLAGLMPCMAKAQPLADRVPANSMLYIGWQGTANPPAGYEQSNFKALLDASNIRQVVNDMIPRLLQRLAMEDPRAAQQINQVLQVVTPMLKHPTALFFEGIELRQAGQPRPKFGLICQAGPDADAMLAQLNNVVAMAGGAPFPVRAFRQNELVALTVGYEAEANPLPDAANSLAGHAGFKSTLGQVQPNPCIIAYVNAEAILALADQAIAAGGDPQAKELWPKIKEATGLSGLRQMVLAEGFDGKEWGVQAFIGAPSPRVGLVSMMEYPPLTEDLYNSIPRGATFAGAVQFDLARLITEVRAAAARISPEAAKVVDQVLGAGQLFLAMNIQRDLAEPLGSQWAFYSDTAVAGRGPLGLVFLNRLNKPVEANRALVKLEITADNLINAQLVRQKMRIGFEQTRIGDLTVHYVALPAISPSWTIKDNTLVAGLYPQVVAAAAQREISSGESILSNASFLALRKRLGGEKANGFVYIDLPRTADDSYQTLLLLTQTGIGLGDLFGIKSPPMVLPTLPQLKQHLSPTAGFSWTDDAGWHFRGISPFPGAELLSMQGGAAAPALMAGMLGIGGFRSAAVAVNTTQRVQSASNLKQIGMAMHLYADQHQGRYPPNLGALRDALPLQVFVVNPEKLRRAGAANLEGDQKAAWIVNNTDYEYVGAELDPAADPEQVVAYEKPEARSGGVNVLFNDGHVEYVTGPRAQEITRR